MLRRAAGRPGERLLGDPAGGGHRTVRRGYRGDSLVLETELASDEGVVRLVDFMPVRGAHPRLVRVV